MNQTEIKSKSYEIRLDDDEKLDEVVTDNVRNFHLEYMSHDHVWIGLYLKNGKTLHINLHSKGKINGAVEVDP